MKSKDIFSDNKNTLNNKFVESNDLLSNYLKDISKVELLSPEEETEYAYQVFLARSTTNEKVLQIGKEARDKLVISNLRLVVNIAKKYTYTNIPLMDLIQEGTMGLIKAIDRFDISKGFRLSTYATWWIRQSITRSISNTSRTIRLPVYVYDALSKINKTRNAYIGEFGKEPDIETLSKITDIPIDNLRMIHFFSSDATSLDQIIGEDNSTLIDITQDEKNTNPEEYNKLKELDEFIEEIMQVLDERERSIVKMRFGIESDKKSLGEIGKMLGISRERVRQLQSRAIKKLKKSITDFNCN